MKSFLNGVFRLEGENRITSVTVKPTEINIVFPRVKSFRLDIRAVTSNGFCINVEMQKARHSRFVERVLLQHSAFMLQSKYEWDQEFFKEYNKLGPVKRKVVDFCTGVLNAKEQLLANVRHIVLVDLYSEKQLEEPTRLSIFCMT